ncbi:MAG: cysteine--tRNA ligase [Elusimicrobia bacterium]|nr:cysteine--tRNA ligase [Elusimicrobiota bacterium]
MPPKISKQSAPSVADVHLTNTLSGRLEKFEPIDPARVGLYVCGLTPYDSTHLGHARCYVTFDLVRRTFEAAGYKLTHVQNFTDIDDKIIARAKEKKMSPFALATNFMEEYFEAIDPLNVLRAHHYPRVTQHIREIVDLTDRLVKKGFAYPAENGDVYFAVARFAGYGKLSKRNTEELLSGARVEVSPHKKDPLDFALWKASAEEGASWESPWGRGRPGWHIECSAMSSKYLGQPFDLHGGGQDLIFPHHENEIAQSEAAQDTPFARYFMHNGFVTVNKEKMSKSLGNFFSLKDIYKSFPPRVVRYYLLTEHYRRPLDFSDAALQEAAAALSRLDEAAELLLFIGGTGKISAAEAKSILKEKMLACLTRDFHSPSALALLQEWAGRVFDAFKKRALSAEAAQQSLHEASACARSLLGIEFPALPREHPKGALALLHERERHRTGKKFQEADAIRRRLLEEFGLLAEDTPYGPRLKNKN